MPLENDKEVKNLDGRASSLAERLASGNSPQALNDDGLKPVASFQALRSRLLALGIWNDWLNSLGADEPEIVKLAKSDFSPTPAGILQPLDSALNDILHANDAKHSRTFARLTYCDGGLPPLPRLVEQYVLNAMGQGALALEAHGTSMFEDFENVLGMESSFVLAEIHEALLPVIVTELHVASETGVMAGATPEARFNDFCDELLQTPTWIRNFFRQYPMALRVVSQIVESRVVAFCEMVARLSDDMAELASLGFVDVAGNFKSVSPAMGDRHRGGRAVRILTTVGGKKVVYKPRSVEIDNAFQRLVAWLNAKGFEPGLYVMPVVDKGSYGWFPFVEAGDAQDSEAVGRFYARQGAHLTLLYLLGGYDFFSENVRASGEFPVLIDLECVQSPLMPAFNGRLFDSAARQYLDESVYRAGLLPSWSWVYLGGEGVNMSALSDVDGQMTPHEVVVWTHLGTDELRQTRARQRMNNDQLHLPSVGGKPHPVDDYIPDLYRGFENAYGLVEQNRIELSGTDGPLAAFDTVECRLVIRNTLDYAAIIHEGSHPRYFSSALEYGLFLDRLWVSRCPRYTPCVIQSETAQIWRGDIPLFTTKGDSRDLFDYAGSLVQSNYFDESASAGAKRRLRRWTKDDCRRQLEIMNCSFAISEQPHVAGPAVVTTNLTNDILPTDEEGIRAAYIGESVNIAESLLSMAVEDERTLTWIGLGMNRVGRWEQTSLDASLYDGGPGVALYFLYLHAATGQQKFLDAFLKILKYSALDAAVQAVDNKERLDDWVLYPPTGTTFPCSALYLCIHGAHFGHVEGLDVVLDATLAWCEAGLKRQPRLDFLNGAAGVARLLVVAYRVLGDKRCLAMAMKYGELILSNAISMSTGLGWASDAYPNPLGGFSHGSAGIAFALADLGTACGDERFISAAVGALEYDRSLFSADKDKWLDLRHSDAENGLSIHWCHGVSGIGLSRILLSGLLPSADLSGDVNRAMEIILADSQANDCLCHGEFGNIDVCLTACDFSENIDWIRRTKEKVANRWRFAHERGSWRGGLPNRTIGICGLFMGTAGVGYGLLRSARPDLVPSVLFLEEPKRRLT